MPRNLLKDQGKPTDFLTVTTTKLHYNTTTLYYIVYLIFDIYDSINLPQTQELTSSVALS